MSTVDAVEAQIRARMLRGDLAPGDRLRQDELAGDLGVSKIPVREALQRLAGHGLLRFETNRGAFVPELSADDAEEVFSLRASIESLLLARAIPGLTIVDLAEAEMALAAGDSTESNWYFHRALYRASGWNRGLAVAEILHASVAPYVRLYTDRLGGSVDSETEHQALLEACRDRDGAAAVALLDTHLRGAAEALIEFLREQEAAS